MPWWSLHSRGITSWAITDVCFSEIRGPGAGCATRLISIKIDSARASVRASALRGRYRTARCRPEDPRQKPLSACIEAEGQLSQDGALLLPGELADTEGRPPWPPALPLRSPRVPGRPRPCPAGRRAQVAPTQTSPRPRHPLSRALEMPGLRSPCPTDESNSSDQTSMRERVTIHEYEWCAMCAFQKEQQWTAICRMTAATATSMVLVKQCCCR